MKRGEPTQNITRINRPFDLLGLGKSNNKEFVPYHMDIMGKFKDSVLPGKLGLLVTDNGVKKFYLMKNSTFLLVGI